MKIHEFLRNWTPEEDAEEFKEDFLDLLDYLSISNYERITIQVVSDIREAELIVDNVDRDTGRIRFGRKGESLENGIIVTYSNAWGQQEADWLLLLRCIAQQALKK